MHQPTAAVAVAVICVWIAGCASTGNAESPTPTPSMIPRPLVERELTGLLLNPDQVNAAMGTTGMAVTYQQTTMSDNGATMAPPECLVIDGAAEAPVYADSGYWAERDQSLNNGDKFTHYLKQAVVLFPSIETASAFFDASAERWGACRDSPRDYIRAGLGRADGLAAIHFHVPAAGLSCRSTPIYSTSNVASELGVFQP